MIDADLQLMHSQSLTGDQALTDAKERDRQEIIQLLERETAAYLRKDYDAWAQCWTQGPETRRFQASVSDGMRVDEGWADYGSAMKARFALHSEPNLSQQQVRCENMNITLGKDMAWATFDQVGVDTGDLFDLAGVQHELRVFHKVDGAWKIACVMVLQRSIDHAQHPLIEVDRSLRVLWMNKEAAARLLEFPDLVVSGGHLRAQDQTRDALLREAVSRAYKLNDERITFIQENAAPVVLGEDDFGSPNYCWVTIRDNTVLVSFDDFKVVDRKLSWAKQVYRLSPTQSQILRLLIDRRDVSNIAVDLGISVNTVRTHLRRMYEKAGARSLHALIREVLNVEPPAT